MQSATLDPTGGETARRRASLPEPIERVGDPTDPRFRPAAQRSVSYHEPPHRVDDPTDPRFQPAATPSPRRTRRSS